MANSGGKIFGLVPLFDPAEGALVRAPLDAGPGWWAGAPGATFDPVSNAFYIVYRQRMPRELGRGVECRIAVSENGISFTDIWALPKTTLDALSLERCSLQRGLDGVWRLFLSYVSPEDKRWRIGLVEAAEPDQFDATSLTPLLTAEDVGGEGVKDPNVFVIGRMTYLLASYATRLPELTPDAEARKHQTGDIYNTGLTLSRTGAAISGDGRHFQWLGDVSPGLGEAAGDGKAAQPSWDAYCKRIGSLLPIEGGGYLAFYDGSASVAENYEEKTGLAMTFDLRTYYSLSPQQPALVSPYASGCLRYVDVLPVGHEIFYYYELARQDGSHELRVSVVERD
ncbi:MAG TPA: hypothetical protein VKU00_25100 [Chthonomonadaceae bacterium]|nr:hypothetical protein [Chthonomonadaceae bacterium]